MSSTPHGLSAEEVGDLSPQERAALEADLSDTEKQLAAGGPGVAVAADPLTDPPATEIVDDDPEKKAAAAPAPASAAEQPKVDAEAEIQASPREQRAVPFQAPEVDPEKVVAARADIDTKAKDSLAGVMKKYDDGEIDQVEMLAQRDAINYDKHRQHAQIDRAVQESELANKHGYQVEEALYTSEVDRFLEDHPIYSVKGTAPHVALDAAIKSLANDPTYTNQPYRKLLEAAHAEVSKYLKVDDAKKSADPADPKAAAAAALKAVQDKRKPDLSGVPPTLAGLPTAAPQNADTDEFAAIDALTSKAANGDADAQFALEVAVSKMTPEQQDRWARAA